MTSSRHYYGYKALQNYPSVVLGFDYRLERNLDIASIDRWLIDAIGVKPDSLVEPQTFDKQFRHYGALVFSRAIALYGELMTMAGMPCYRAGRILTIEPVRDSTERARVTVLLHAIDNLPVETFGDLFQKSLKVVQSVLISAQTPETTEKVFALIYEIIKSAAKNTPFKVADQSILDMADRQGVPYRHLGLGLVRLGWGSKSRLLRTSISDADSWLAKEICGNKQMTSRMLRTAGFPVPDNMLAPSAQDALSAAEKLGWPVVVKPPHMERSEGVTTDIRDEAGLLAAYKRASAYDPHVLIERHVPGDCHRIFVAEGVVIYVIRRLAVAVIGDGRQTVAQLIDRANRAQLAIPPWKREKPLPLDGLTDASLDKQGLTRGSVPQNGRRVKLRDIQSHEWGGEPENLTPKIHPDNARLAIDITRLVGAAIAGVDLMSTDITQPWHANGAVINEVNFQPEFRWWDREREARRVITALVQDDGRIPVHLVTGHGDLLARARALKAELGRRGSLSYLTTAAYSEDGDGAEITMSLSSLFERSIALLMRPAVDALILVGPETDLLGQGFPVDEFASVVIADSDERRAEATLRSLQQQVVVRSFHRTNA